MLAAAEIRAGDAELVVAGGMEYDEPGAVPVARRASATGWATRDSIDATVQDGLWCAVEDCHMGTHAERVAIKDHVSRADQDAFALESHQRAIAAIDAGRFDDELVPVPVTDAQGAARRMSTSTRARAATRPLEALARLKPAFDLPDRRGPAAGDARRHRHRRQRAGHHRRRRGDGRRQRARRRAATG